VGLRDSFYRCDGWDIDAPRNTEIKHGLERITRVNRTGIVEIISIRKITFFTSVPINKVASWGTESTGVAEFLVVFMLYIRQVLSSNLGLEIGSPD
jgi:hypothetical protein